MYYFLKLKGEELEKFNQAKFDYYKKVNSFGAIIIAVTSIFYFISDCQIVGAFSWNTLLPRTFIILPLILYIFITKKTNNYKIVVSLTYLLAHGIMWCTIWAIVYLPDKSHAQEGFIIMHFMFVVFSFAASFRLSVFFHSMIIFNILSSHLFNHYERVDIMLSLGIPCIMGTIVLQIVLSLAFKDHYNTKKELMQMSMVDFLTKAYNRNILNTLIEKDSYRFVSSLGEKVQLLLVDIDFFKVINDVHGHAAGDLVLKSTAHTIKSNLRKDDIFIRYGGEEFLIIIPRTERAEAKQIAERVRVAVENTENEVQKVTISGGLSSYQDNYKDAIERADLALYRSKQEGRNKISVETSIT